jgi:hypothetical protein
MEGTYTREAKIQFIRCVDRLADARKISWKVVGSFVKETLTGEKNNLNTLEFLFTNAKTTSGVSDIINDLFIMNFVTNWVIVDYIVYMKATIIVDSQEVHFDCNFYDGFYECVLSSEQIILNQSGISLLYGSDYGDDHNMNKGIALLNKIGDIKSKTDRLLGSYINIPDNITYRVKNAKIMKIQSNAFQQGYNVKGKRILYIDSKEHMCPICFERQTNNTVLQCLHKFCVNCLAKHMELIGDCHSKCPLCRSPLMLSLVENL